MYIDKFEESKELRKVFAVVVLFVLILLLVLSVKATSSVDSVTEYFEKAREELIGFYSSEIVSHAGIILGLFVAFSTVASRWRSFFRKNHSLWHEIFFLLLLGSILSLTVYSVARLVYWSSLGGDVMYATPLKLEQTLNVTFIESNVTSIIIHLNNYSGQRFWTQSTTTFDVVRLFQPNDIVQLAVYLVVIGLIPFFPWLIWKLAKRQFDSSARIDRPVAAIFLHVKSERKLSRYDDAYKLVLTSFGIAFAFGSILFLSLGSDFKTSEARFFAPFVVIYLLSLLMWCVGHVISSKELEIMFKLLGWLFVLTFLPFNFLVLLALASSGLLYHFFYWLGTILGLVIYWLIYRSFKEFHSLRSVRLIVFPISLAMSIAVIIIGLIV